MDGSVNPDCSLVKAGVYIVKSNVGMLRPPTDSEALGSEGLISTLPGNHPVPNCNFRRVTEMPNLKLPRNQIAPALGNFFHVLTPFRVDH